jgi:hypothetical protein
MPPDFRLFGGRCYTASVLSCGPAVKQKKPRYRPKLHKGKDGGGALIPQKGALSMSPRVSLPIAV